MGAIGRQRGEEGAERARERVGASLDGPVLVEQAGRVEAGGERAVRELGE